MRKIVSMSKTNPDVIHYQCNVADDCMSGEMCPLMCLGCTCDSYASTWLKFQRRPTILNSVDCGHLNQFSVRDEIGISIRVMMPLR